MQLKFHCNKEAQRGLVFKDADFIPYSFAPVGLTAELVGFTSPDQLRVVKLYDINSRGEIIEHDVSDMPEAAFQQDGHVWKVSIVTEIAGLKSSFEAIVDPTTWKLTTAGSVRGYKFW